MMDEVKRWLVERRTMKVKFCARVSTKILSNIISPGDRIFSDT